MTGATTHVYVGDTTTAAVDTINASAATGTTTLSPGMGNDILTLGSATDTIKMTTAILNGNDQVTGFTRGANSDIFNISLGALRAGSDAFNFKAGDGSTAAATGSTLTEFVVTTGSIGAGKALLTGTEITILTGGTYTNVAAMITDVKANMSTQAAIATAPAGVDLPVLWSDGTNTYLTAMHVVNATATAVALSSANNTVTDGGVLLQFTGMTTVAAGDFNAANFVFIV
jgi:hypothetical protein